MTTPYQPAPSAMPMPMQSMGGAAAGGGYPTLPPPAPMMPGVAMPPPQQQMGAGATIQMDPNVALQQQAMMMQMMGGAGMMPSAMMMNTAAFQGQPPPGLMPRGDGSLHGESSKKIWVAFSFIFMAVGIFIGVWPFIAAQPTTATSSTNTTTTTYPPALVASSSSASLFERHAEALRYRGRSSGGGSSGPPPKWVAAFGALFFLAGFAVLYSLKSYVTRIDDTRVEASYSRLAFWLCARKHINVSHDAVKSVEIKATGSTRTNHNTSITYEPQITTSDSSDPVPLCEFSGAYGDLTNVEHWRFFAASKWPQAQFVGPSHDAINSLSRNNYSNNYH